jgi:hypothetical protein
MEFCLFEECLPTLGNIRFWNLKKNFKHESLNVKFSRKFNKSDLLLKESELHIFLDRLHLCDGRLLLRVFCSN